MRGLLAFAVLGALVACGDDGVRHLPDAPDFIPDAPEPDAPTMGVVKLTITSGTAGVMGVRVIFQNPDSSVVLSTTTDANGVASATMGVGGFVTAIDPFPQPVPTGVAVNGDLRTFAGVKPGDQLVLHEEIGHPLLNVTLNIPLDAAISRYFLHLPCEDSVFDITGGGGSGSGSGAPGGPLSIPNCGDATSDMLLEGQDVNGVVVKTLFKANVPVSEGGVVDLTAETYAAASTSTFMYTHVPAAFTLLDVENFVASTHGLMYDSFSSVDVANGMAALSTPAPAVIPGSLSVTLTDMFGNFGRHEVIGWGASTNMYTLDATNVLLAEYTAQPTFDVTTHATTWTQDATGVAPDFSVHTVNLNRPTTGQNWSWQIVAPFGTGPTVTMPVLPVDGATFNPVTGDNANVNEFSTAKVPGGYDAIRNNVLAVNSPVDIAVGASGQAVVETLQLPKAVRAAEIRRGLGAHKVIKTARRH